MKRNIGFSEDGWNSYAWWQEQDEKALKRVNDLIDAAALTPFEGIGQPEPLLGSLAGYWARRIDSAHHLVYRVTDDDLTIIACRHGD